MSPSNLSLAVEEVKRNLNEPSQLERLRELLQDVKIVQEVDPSMLCPVDLPEKDRPLLLAAISAGADYFLTGDITHSRARQKPPATRKEIFSCS